MLRLNKSLLQAIDMKLVSASSSIREVEIVVGVVIVFSLSEEGANHVDGYGEPADSEPDSKAEVNDESLDEELGGTTVEEMEEPLLGSVRSVMPDVASHVGFLLIEVVLSVPSSVLHLWHSQTFAVNQSHVLHVAQLVVS